MISFWLRIVIRLAEYTLVCTRMYSYVLVCTRMYLYVLILMQVPQSYYFNFNEHLRSTGYQGMDHPVKPRHAAEMIRPGPRRAVAHDISPAIDAVGSRSIILKFYIKKLYIYFLRWLFSG